MSRKLWVRLFHCFEGIHREVALQRPLLAAPQCYLCGQRVPSGLVGEVVQSYGVLAPRESLHFRPHPLVWLLQTLMRL
jgi:hypothetical protein